MSESFRAGAPRTPEAGKEKLSTEEQRKKLRAVVIETTRLTEAQARDVAEHRMTESKEDRSKGWFTRTVTRIWKHNLFQEYYRQKEINTARRDIVEGENLYAGEEGAGTAEHQAAMNAIIDRFTSEYETDVLRTEERDSKQTVEQGEANARITALVREYAGNPEMSKAAFDEERGRILAMIDPAYRTGSTTYADNFFELATEARKAVEHGTRLDQLDLDVSLTLGEARESLNTEAKMNTFDRIMEKVKGTRLGSLATNETVVSIAALAYAGMKAGGLGFLKSNAVKVATFGAGVAIASGLSGYNEAVRLKRERAQHMRESAKGMKFEEGAERRNEMDENKYESRSARDITASLEASVEKVNAGTLSPEELAATLSTLADLESRIALGDERKADLISYSRFDQVEQERAALLVARARMKVALRRQDPEQFETRLADLVRERRNSLTTGEEGLDQKDRIYAKMRNGKVAGTMMRTALVGAGLGLVGQEVAAAFDQNQGGLLGGIWKNLTGQKDQIEHGATAFEGARRALFPGSGPRMPEGVLHEVPVGNTLVGLPQGADLIQNPDGTYDLMRGSDVVADNIKLEFGPNGDLTEASKLLLGGDDIGATFSVTEGETVTSAAYVEANEDLTHHIRRGLWYDNDTPKPVFDKNELKQWWGGENGSGIDAKGNYVFSVNHMAPGGSYHDNLSVDAQERLKAGGLKMLFSLSRDTQHQVFEVAIDAQGNAIIPPDSEIAKLMFKEVDGHAVFIGQYAEVAQDMGLDQDGVEKVRILSTVVGEGRDSIVTPPVPHVFLDVPDSSDVEVPPFLPFAWARRPMERGMYGPMTPGGVPLLTPVELAYYYGAPMTDEQREAYKERFSSSIRENPDASLNANVEIDGYLKQLDGEYLERITTLAHSVEPMNPKCELSICIPVAGHQEEANIERTLSSYLHQTADPDTFELVLFVNHPETDKSGNPVTPDGTMERILAFKAAHPQLNIRVMQAVLPNDEANMGNIRKLLNDANLIRSQERGDNKDTIFVSNDADTKGVAPEYVQNFMNKLAESDDADALMGQLDWDPEAYIRNPLVHIGTRLFQYFEAINRRTEGSIASSGANFAFKSSIYAAIGGYSSGIHLAEDVDLGRRIKLAREGASTHIPVAFGGAKVSRLYTSARRAERAVRSGLSAVEQWDQGFSAFDDEVRKTKWEDTGKAPDYDDPAIVALLTVELETTINRTLRNASSWQDSERFENNMHRSLGWLGVKFERVGEHRIRITDASRLIQDLKTYQQEGMRIMALKTGALETNNSIVKPRVRVKAKSRESDSQNLNEGTKAPTSLPTELEGRITSAITTGKWKEIDSILADTSAEKKTRDSVLSLIATEVTADTDLARDRFEQVRSFLKEESANGRDLIDGGVQFLVYRETSTRVLKVPTSRLWKLVKFIEWGDSDVNSLVTEVNNMEKTSEESLSGLKSLGVDDSFAEIGHPKIMPDNSYEQDFAAPLHEYFETHTLEQNKVLIEKYINNIFSHWKSGFSDVVFNFRVNNGVTASEEVILSDIGELTFSKEEVARHIREKTWLGQFSYTSLEDQELKDHFKTKMEELVTVENLEKTWLSGKQ